MFNEFTENIEKLQNILISRATGGESYSREYKRIRNDLINSYLEDELPHYLRRCFDLDQFWDFIKEKFPSYRERREYIRSSLSKLKIGENNMSQILKSIFLSHSSKDKFFVRNLAQHLNEYGIKVWLDEAEIKIGDSLVDKIGNAIESTDYVGVILSYNSVNSEWVQKELQLAIQKEIAAKKVVILPILIEPVEIPHFLKDKLYADFTDPKNFDAQLSKIVQAMGYDSSTKKEQNQTVEIEPEKPKILETSSQKELSIFEDIKIIGIDENLTYNPDKSKKLYNIYLKLSYAPPAEWEQIFTEERRFPRHTMWRRAWIEGNHIVIHCVPEELEQYHAKDLKSDVKNSNTKYRNYLTEEAQKEARKIQREISEQNMISNLKNKIDFNED